MGGGVIKTLMNVDQIYSYFGLIAIIETLYMVTKINTFTELYVTHFIYIMYSVAKPYFYMYNVKY